MPLYNGSADVPLAMQAEYSGTNPIYVGEAPPGTAVTDAGWRIKKLTYDGSSNVTVVQWAINKGVYADWNCVWNSRATYTYG